MSFTDVSREDNTAVDALNALTNGLEGHFCSGTLLIFEILI